MTMSDQDTGLTAYEKAMEIFEEVARKNFIDAEALEAFCENMGIDAEDCEEHIGDFQEAFVGYYRSNEIFAECLFEEEGVLDRVDSRLLNHINWDEVWECELRFDFFEENNYYFRNI